MTLRLTPIHSQEDKTIVAGDVRWMMAREDVKCIEVLACLPPMCDVKMNQKFS